ncbi:MAG: hypothetical protein SFY69_00010 [Planctomycetota bacterium]|nr:hypothetical protein [Planctomycetota bacterium]
MHSVLKTNDHESAQAAATSAPVGRCRKSKGLMAGAMTARPMSVEAERHFQAALQRIVADIVQKNLQSRGEIEK